MRSVLRALTRPTGPARRPARPNRFRARLEPLESRLVMSVSYGALTQGLDSSILSTEAAVSKALDLSTVALPFLGSSAQSYKGTVLNALESARSTIDSTLKTINARAQASAIGTAIGSALDSAKIGHDPVMVSNYDPASGNITIALNLRTQTGVSQPTNFSLGLPSLPITVTGSGGLTAMLTVEYDNLQFGMNNGQAFVDTSAPNEFRVSFDTGVANNTSISADFGLFQVSAAPINPKTFGLHGGIAFDINPKGVTPTLFGSANADMTLTGAVGGGTPTGNFKFPNIAADFHLNWSLGGTNADPRTSSLSNFGGSAPNVSFGNVRVGLGEYLSDVLAPLTTALQTYLTYYKPYLELINFNIPGLDDVFDAVGIPGTGSTPAASVLGIAKVLTNTGLIDDPIVNLLVKYSTFLTDLKSQFGDLTNPKVNGLPGNTMVNLGSFDLLGDGDLRSLPNAGGYSGTADLTTLAAHVTQVGSKVQDVLNGLGATTYAGALGAALNRLNTAISLTFPFSDSPVKGAFAMLLGRDVPLVQFTFNLPSVFNVQLSKLMDKFGPPTFGFNNGFPAEARFDGSLNVNVYLSGGYDTRGLREMIANQGDAGYLADGFFLDSSQPIFSADGSFIVEAGPKFGGFVYPLGSKTGVEVGFEGRGEFDFKKLSVSFDDLNADGDNKFRPFSADDASRNLFTASGSLSGSLSGGGYAELSSFLTGDQRVNVGPQFHLNLGTFLDFNSSSYNATNPFRPASTPGPTFQTVTYDFAALRPDLANDGTHDDIYAYVQNDSLIISLNGEVGPLGGGTFLKSYPIHTVRSDGTLVTVNKLILKGGQDGATFHPITPSLQYQIIGQGIKKPDTSNQPVPEQTTDVLDVFDVGFRTTSDQVKIGGTGAYGLSELVLTPYQGTTPQPATDILYTHMTSVNVDLSLTKQDFVSITAASPVPVDLKLSPGDDNVTIEAGLTADNLAQQYTIHGDGGNDTVTFKKTVATSTYGSANGLLFGPIDAYTVDDRHLTYQSQQNIGGGKNTIPVAQNRMITVNYDGIKNVVVDQAVTQNATFQVAPIDAGEKVTLNGPLFVNNVFRNPTATYTVGTDYHTLDGYLGSLIINDRSGTGTLVLDDSADALARPTNSDDYGATVSTGYSVTGGSLSRTRTISYPLGSTRPSPVSTFQIQEPNTGLANLRVLAGAGSNTFDIGSLPHGTTTLVGGPGNDSFLRRLTPLGLPGALSLVGNGGNDTFTYDNAALADTSTPTAATINTPSYALSFTAANSGTLHFSDHQTGFHTAPFNQVIHDDFTPFEDVTFDGIENVAILGSGTSKNTFTMTGNTAANVSFRTSALADSVTVASPPATFPRGSLSITGFGPSSVAINTGTLDFPALTVQGDSVTLDDSLSPVSHHYVVDQGVFNGWFTRDLTRFALTVRGLYVKGGLGNDVFDLKQGSIEQGPNVSTWLEGGGGDDTFNLVHDTSEGASAPVRSLNGFSGVYLVVDGGTGKNTVVADDSGSASYHYDAIQNGLLNVGDYGAGATYLTRDSQRVLISERISKLSLLTGAATTRVLSLPTSMTFSVTAPSSAYVAVGNPVSYIGGGAVAAADMENILGSVEVHSTSTGSGPIVSLDDRASSTAHHVTVTPNGTGGVISGFGPGLVSIIGYTPATVTILGSGGNNTYTILGRLPGLRIDGGSGTNTLDYSGYLSPVNVDLAAGTATGIDHGIARIARVILPKK